MLKMPTKLILFLLASFLFIGFVFFSYIVSKETLTQLDFDTTVKLQDRLPRKVDSPFSMISLIGTAEATVVTWFVMLVFLLLKKMYLTAVSLILMPLSVLIEIYGKIVLFHPAPPHFLYRGIFDFVLPSKYYIHTNYSYPSGHVTRLTFIIVFMMTYTYLRFKPRNQIFVQSFLVMLLVLVGVSRVYLGEHWASDVIGGCLLGGSFGLISGLTIPRKTSLA